MHSDRLRIEFLSELKVKLKIYAILFQSIIKRSCKRIRVSLSLIKRLKVHLDSQDKRTNQSFGCHFNLKRGWLHRKIIIIIILLQNKIREQNSKRSELTYYRGTCYNK